MVMCPKEYTHNAFLAEIDKKNICWTNETDLTKAAEDNAKHANIQ